MEKLGKHLREKILIVDATRFHRAIASDVLARAGYLTVEGEKGSKTLELVSTESPDLIILDSSTPDLDGPEVCQRLKSDPFTNHIPVLMLMKGPAGSSKDGADQTNSTRTGWDGYIAQPFTAEELLAQVQSLLRESFHYDPLTHLPAAPYIHREIDSRLAQNRPLAAVYADLDHFRIYNQACGHDAGDQLLMRVAQLLVDLLPARSAFAGHLGSDDFMAVMAPEYAETFAETLVDQFKGFQTEIYQPEDYQRGYIVVQNRRGQPVQWPLLKMSAALVTNERRALINYVQVSELLAEVMTFVKSQGGGQWARDRRSE